MPGPNSAEFFPGQTYGPAAEKCGYLGEIMKFLVVKLGYGLANTTPTVVSASSPLPTGGGSKTGTVAAGAGNTVIKASPGQLCSVLVTTAGTGTGNVIIFDNATTNSGTVIGQIPATVTVNNLTAFNFPAQNGITVQNVANGPVLTISYF